MFEIVKEINEQQIIDDVTLEALIVEDDANDLVLNEDAVSLEQYIGTMTNAQELVFRLEALQKVLVEYGISSSTMKAVDPENELMNVMSLESYDNLEALTSEQHDAALEGLAEVIKKIATRIRGSFVKIGKSTMKVLIYLFTSIQTKQKIAQKLITNVKELGIKDTDLDGVTIKALMFTDFEKFHNTSKAISRFFSNSEHMVTEGRHLMVNSNLTEEIALKYYKKYFADFDTVIAEADPLEMYYGFYFNQDMGRVFRTSVSWKKQIIELKKYSIRKLVKDAEDLNQHTAKIVRDNDAHLKSINATIKVWEGWDNFVKKFKEIGGPIHQARMRIGSIVETYDFMHMFLWVGTMHATQLSLSSSISMLKAAVSAKK